MTIPASSIVSVIPSVLSAGGSGLQLSGLFLTNGTRTPIGSILTFSSALGVSAYYGPGSTEYAQSVIYFNGFQNSNIKPAALLFAQYNQSAVPGYLRGASTASLTLAQLQALSGTLIVTVGGVLKTSASISLATATSPSNAATLIQAGFTGANLYDAITSSASTIAAGTATSVTGSITGYTLTVTAVGSGAPVVGGVLAGTGVTTGTYITAQLTGSAGGVGTYSVSVQQTVASTTITQTYGLLTVVAISSGTLAVGQVISGGTTTAGTTITALGSGTGGAGTYITSGGSQTVSATTISAGPLTWTYDSVASAFVVTGGTPGVTGTMSYASGTLSASLFLTLATGAVTSQGAAASTPIAFMDSVVLQTTNWATFTTLFDPDNAYGNANKLLFASWVNGTNDQFMYVAPDTDITPTLSSAATGSLGYLLASTNSSGTYPVYDPSSAGQGAFICGMVASIDFTQTNGRITLAFKSQSGLSATVTNETVANNLIANHYNFYGSYATAAEGFVFEYPGSVSGPFEWADSYVNQIWLNSGFQLALMNMLVGLKSVPYNAVGYAQIRAALTSQIQAALNAGVINPGIQLSSLQISEVNTAAGLPIDQQLSSVGYYLQVLPATAQTRGNRQSPPCTFWYCDGGSIQKINLASVEVQ